MLSERVAETGCPIVYVNQVGGQDELVFDGASLVMDPDGAVVASAPQFAEAVLVVDITAGAAAADGPDRRAPDRGSPAAAVSGEHPGPGADAGTGAGGAAPVLDPEAEVYEALVLGTRDYVAKNGFTDAVIGLSGGIDSSLVAAMAVDALGPDQVHGVTMPSRYSSEGSVADAVTLCGQPRHRASPPCPSSRPTGPWPPRWRRSSG